MNVAEGNAFSTWNPAGTVTAPEDGGYDFALDSAGRVLAGTQSGVFRSTNSGASWTAINSGIETFGIRRVTSAPEGTIFAGSNTNGVFRSTDDGASWMPVNTGLGDLSVKALLATPSGTVVVATAEGLFVSADNGDTWHPTESQLPAGTALDLANHADLGLAAGTNGLGVWSTPDEGVTWNSHSHGVFVSYPETVVQTAAGTFLVNGFDSGIFRADGPDDSSPDTRTSESTGTSSRIRRRRLDRGNRWERPRPRCPPTHSPTRSTDRRNSGSDSGTLPRSNCGSSTWRAGSSGSWRAAPARQETTGSSGTGDPRKGARVASGAYFAQLTAGGRDDTVRLFLLR